MQTNLYVPPPNPDNIRICVLDAPPTVRAISGVNIADGTILGSEVAGKYLQGIGYDLISVVFGQLLKWNYTIAYHTFASFGFDSILYDTRNQISCDVAIQNFFIAPERDQCTTTCLQPTLVNNQLPMPFSNDAFYIPYSCCIDFSQPFFIGGWAITSMISTGGDLNYINVFFQQPIVYAMSVAVICTFFMAHLIWLIERNWTHTTPTRPIVDFGDHYLDGLRDGVWFISNTLLNGVITSESLIKTPFGRFICTIWVMFGILLASFITSVISSTLTTTILSANQILTVQSLAGLTVCMESGFYDSFFTQHYPGIGVKKIFVSYISDCYPILASGGAQAIFSVRDDSVNYFSNGNGAGMLLSATITSQNYGIAWPQAWIYGSMVNEAILNFVGDVYATKPSYANSVLRWYSGDGSTITYGGSAIPKVAPWNWSLIGSAIALIGAYMLLQLIVGVGVYLNEKDNGKENIGKGGATKSLTKSTSLYMSLKQTGSVLKSVAKMMTSRSSLGKSLENGDALEQGGHSMGRFSNVSIGGGVDHLTLMQALRHIYQDNPV